MQDLSTWGPKLLAGMKGLPGFQDVNTDAQNAGLQEMITYDRPTAARVARPGKLPDDAFAGTVSGASAAPARRPG